MELRLAPLGEDEYRAWLARYDRAQDEVAARQEASDRGCDRPLWYGPDGRPVTASAANWLMSQPENRIVARTRVGRRIVCTDWMALDLALGSEHTPALMFETMVAWMQRGGRRERMLWLQWRYPSREAALRGHQRAVMHCRNRAYEVATPQRRTGGMPPMTKAERRRAERFWRELLGDLEGWKPTGLLNLPGIEVARPVIPGHAT